MPTVKTYADAADLVREGRELLREGDDSAHADSALVHARKAIEPVRKKLRTITVAKNAPPDPKQRSLAERKAIFIEALVSYIAGAAHNDPTTKTFEYTSTNANCTRRRSRADPERQRERLSPACRDPSRRNGSQPDTPGVARRAPRSTGRLAAR